METINVVLAVLGASTVLFMYLAAKWKTRAIRVRSNLMTSVRLLEIVTLEGDKLGLKLDWNDPRGLTINGRVIHER